jgi:hypothetical protein
VDFDTRPDLVLITVSFAELSVSTTSLGLGLTSLLSNMSSNINARSAIGARVRNFKFLTYVFPSNVQVNYVKSSSFEFLTHLEFSKLDLEI